MTAGTATTTGTSTTTMSYLTEAAATLEYETYDYSLPHSKTVDLIGDEFIKKDPERGRAVQSRAPAQQSSLPPLTYTTTTIPTISAGGAGETPHPQEGGNVLYCNLDDLSRYIPDNFSFDSLEGGAGLGGEECQVQVVSLGGGQHGLVGGGGGQQHPGAVQIQVRQRVGQVEAGWLHAATVNTRELPPLNIVYTLTGLESRLWEVNPMLSF